jgi:hypothetical protein
MMNPEGSGSSACASAPIDEGLKAGTARLLADTGWEGLFMVEFLRDAQGRAWFIEFNGRSWGSMALARARGAEYPAWAVGTALGLGPVASPPGGHAVCRHLGRELVHVMFAARGPRNGSSDGWPSFWSAARAVFRIGSNDRLYNFRGGQRAFLLLDTWATLTGMLRSR